MIKWHQISIRRVKVKQSRSTTRKMMYRYFNTSWVTSTWWKWQLKCTFKLHFEKRQLNNQKFVMWDKFGVIWGNLLININPYLEGTIQPRTLSIWKSLLRFVWTVQWRHDWFVEEVGRSFSLKVRVSVDKGQSHEWARLAVGL